MRARYREPAGRGNSAFRLYDSRAAIQLLGFTAAHAAMRAFELMAAHAAIQPIELMAAHAAMRP